MNNPISIYDPSRFDSALHGYTLEQRKAGGKTRTRTGKKHPVYKFYLPDHVDSVSTPDGYIHGRSGGQARIKAAVRDSKGRFIK